MKISTFVFLDCETTGLPALQHNKTRITELCLIAVQRDHMMLGVTPRVQNKITICLNPMKMIDSEATRVSGLGNELLEFQSGFNEQTCSLLNNFLALLPKPVCLVAHNGYNFDYPILKAQLAGINKSISEDTLCIDSLLAFRNLLDPGIHIETTESENLEIWRMLSDELDSSLYEACIEIEKTHMKTTDVNEAQRINETTPKRRTKYDPKCSRIRARKRLDFDIRTTSKPANFRLGTIYTHLTGKTPANAHQAEVDVLMLMESAMQLAEKFIEWAEDNAMKFEDVPVMQPGKKFAYWFHR